MTIEVLYVSKNYGGKPYLKGASLNISSGSVISFVGTKKSGKTALLRIIMGLEEADGGGIMKKSALLELEGIDLRRFTFPK